jgi:glucosamine-6-phosphate deaminase
MNVKIFENRRAMSEAAAEHAAAILKRTIGQSGRARLVAATGASQLEFLRALVTTPGIAWASVELFHLDEYVGLPLSHPASFRRYLLDNLITPAGIVDHHLINGEAPDLAAECQRVGAALSSRPVEVAFVGIGENGHLAFNDPPADFTATDPYLVVQLDEACRRQQVGEGWFAGLADVPQTAVSMSIQQILKAREILCIVPDARKAAATRATLEGEITPQVPASILRSHSNVTLFLDEPAASMLDAKTR